MLAVGVFSFQGTSARYPAAKVETQVLICSALMVNVRRIWRHEQQLAQNKSQEVASLLSCCCLRLRSWVHGLSFHHFFGSAPALVGR